MSNVDNELFELCKEVYKRTGWEQESGYFSPVFWRHNGELDSNAIDAVCPLYTSDYLLEKLPQGIKGNYLNMFSAGITSWYALYGRTSTAKDTGLYGESNSPLKALLKLTIALNEAGELK